MKKYMVQGKLKEPCGTLLPFALVVYADTSTEAEKIVRYMFKGSGAIVLQLKFINPGEYS